ncbi:MAG: hypothetical protein GY774_33300, partial [Planctomycetes bacterium]|nr:hypothetical protein [Planctomycetota bacterium]
MITCKKLSLNNPNAIAMRSSRRRKIDKERLRQHVQEHPDLYLRERAAHFDVSINAMWKAMRKLGYR